MYASTILYWAKFLGVPGSLLLAICTHESGLKNTINQYDGGSPSYGICQIKADTARMLGFAGELESDLMVPGLNAWYAAKYLGYQLKRYQGDWCKAVSAFNAGRYNPSTVVPGKPRNLRYVKGVTLYLDDKHKDLLACGPRKVVLE